MKGIIESFVHDVFKGLVEITKSETPRLQFIHESVKDLLVKGNGMHITGAAPSSNFISERHDRLKCYCARQLTA
jgi:hypothetical protein